MNVVRRIGVWLSLSAASSGFMLIAIIAQAQTPSDDVRIIELDGTLEIFTVGAQRWVLTTTNQPLFPHDRLRTGPNSRMAVRWSDSSVVRFGPRAEIEVLPPHEQGAQAGLRLFEGILSFFHRGQPGRIRVVTRGAVAGIKGTEFVIAVDKLPNDNERTTLWVIDGTVQFSNEIGSLQLNNYQQALAEPGQAPVPAPGFVANNLLQWAFYYPGVLYLGDLQFTRDEEQLLAESLAAYRKGDLLGALAKYGARLPNSESERVYHAALLLSVGEVRKSSDALEQLMQADASERAQRLAAALSQLIAAVKYEPSPSGRTPELPTELLATSYYEQSRAGGDPTLERALALATRAATNVADFGFAWARVAELEFSFGRTTKALNALDKALDISPRDAQALALKGFLFAAQNNARQAIDWFNSAIEVDSALANAWLGRGLCRIRRGDSAGGREDLLIAAALEPRRAELRSYLGKAYSDSGDTNRALHELDLAKDIDPKDPTAWFYSALAKAKQNRINEAIRDLEQSQELNDNRRVYRSKLRLDQDRAVQSANLALL